MSTAAAPEASAYVTASDAAALAGVTRQTVRRWMSEGLVGSRRLPFCRPKVYLPDVEKLVGGATRAAR